MTSSPKIIYLLKEDHTCNMRSKSEEFGIALSSYKDCEKYIRKYKNVFAEVAEIKVFDTLEEIETYLKRDIIND